MPDEKLNLQNSGVVEMSMRITKASYQKTDDTPRHWAAVDSDTDPDLYQEKMSVDLYKDFISRIENNTPIPEAFKSAICEDEVWCGGMPYLSIAHYKAGSDGNNLPGSVTNVYIDGNRLKSKGILHDNSLGRKVFESLCDDIKQKSEVDHKPVRISIGFLDLEHKHLSEVGGQEFTFTRTDVGQICPMCAQGIGGKVYTKGQLVHLAMTRVPVNTRTEMNVERSMDDEIKTKRDDAASIVGELADTLEEKSIAGGVLVVRAEDGSMPTPDASELKPCYDPNTGGWNQECINSVMDKYMPEIRNSIGVPVKSTTVPKELLDAVVTHIYKSNGYDIPVVEESKMDTVVEKMVAGGESVPEKKFTFAGLDGDGRNTLPNPVKSDAPKEDEEEKKEEKMEAKSTLDTSFEALKSVISGKGSAEDLQNAFNLLGSEVEKAYVPEKPQVDMSNLAEIVKSAVAQAVAPLNMEIATLKSQIGAVNTQSGAVVKSKALSINSFTNPEQMISKSVTPTLQPHQKLSQIQQLARKSTGLQS